MPQPEERRRHRRLCIRLPIECVAAVGDRRMTYRTVTHDISSGGVCFESETDEFPIGTSLEMGLEIPPGDGHSPYPGRVRGTGRVVRGDRLAEHGGPPRFRIAARYSKPLKLAF